MIEVKIDSIRASMMSDHRVIILKEIGRERYLPIWIGRYEAEAIALAKQLDADWFLTDDSAARLFAEAAGLETHGSLGIVLWAAATGHLAQAKAKDALERLARSSLWVSASVLDEARAALDELFR